MCIICLVMCGYTCFKAGVDYDELPETSNAEYSYVAAPNVTVNLEASHTGHSGANNLLEQVIVSGVNDDSDNQAC